MSILANLTAEQLEFLKKLVRHKDRGLLSLDDCIEAIVADHNVTPSVAETMLDEVARTTSFSS
jgi:hypothetical protein